MRPYGELLFYLGAILGIGAVMFDYWIPEPKLIALLALIAWANGIRLGWEVDARKQGRQP